MGQVLVQEDWAGGKENAFGGWEEGRKKGTKVITMGEHNELNGKEKMEAPRDSQRSSMEGHNKEGKGDNIVKKLKIGVKREEILKEDRSQIREVEGKERNKATSRSDEASIHWQMDSAEWNLMVKSIVVTLSDTRK